MKEIFKITKFTNKYVLVLLLLLSMKIYCQNEVSLIIDKTKGTDIISRSYYSSISEVEVNGKSGTIDNYKNLLDKNTNNVKIIFNKYMNTCSSMFSGLKGIISIDFSNFFSSNVKSTAYMFYDCSSLITLNLNNFIASSVENMENMFYGCNSLISLDLKNFDTSSVTNMGYMFHYCNKLESLNIINFDTSSVKNMGYMFSY